MSYRIEHDSMGEVRVPSDKLWGAQTQRSLENFRIGNKSERMPQEIIRAFATVKAAAAICNAELCPRRMTKEKADAIVSACREIADGKLADHFPLVVYQTGSGTQTNMNVNEVVAARANQLLGKNAVHPNDDVNMSQSSNDTFPTAMHVSAVTAIEQKVLPALDKLIGTFLKLEKDNTGVLKCGRTHLQDATPIAFSQEISGWRSSLESDRKMIKASVAPMLKLALGGTAVGTGLNAPAGFDTKVASVIAEMTGFDFVSAKNKFEALTSKNALVFSHGALKALAADLMKIANDIRWLASGPRLGLGEISIPENEPGSSIMPGKVNPTQCEAVTMVAVQVMADDVAIGTCASMGNFELNVFMPVCIDNYLRSARLLSDVMLSFEKNCVSGIVANKEKMKENLHRSLMNVTALNVHIGYENAAKVAHLAHEEGITLKEACLALGMLTAEEFDRAVDPEKMV